MIRRWGEKREDEGIQNTRKWKMIRGRGEERASKT